jgi:hypothetical protein
LALLDGHEVLQVLLRHSVDDELSPSRSVAQTNRRGGFAGKVFEQTPLKVKDIRGQRVCRAKSSMNSCQGEPLWLSVKVAKMRK